MAPFHPNRRSQAVTKKEAERKLPRLLSLLEKQYGKTAPPEPTEEPTDDMIRLVLLECTSERKAERAFKLLRERFVDLNEARVSSAFEIQEVISCVEGAAAKAVRIKEILEGLLEKQNVLSLQRIEELPPREALDHLTSTNGISWADAAQLMLVRYGHPLLPMNEAVAGAAARIGLCRAGLSIERARKTLGSVVSKRRYWDFFRLMQCHAWRICLEQDLQCGKCPLARSCEYAAAQAKRKAKPKKRAATTRKSTAKSSARSRPAKGKAKKKTKKEVAKRSR